MKKFIKGSVVEIVQRRGRFIGDKSGLKMDLKTASKYTSHTSWGGLFFRGKNKDQVVR